MYHGIINIYKEKGFTSHDVVAKLRGILKQKKIGHTGTLDPDAEGVLPVCLGSATKLCDMLTDRDKEYEAVLQLGVSTDTQDMSGKVLEQREVSVDEETLREIIMNFVGEYAQIPPMYSALKVDGKKLYELARQGREVERKPRTVYIHSIEILSMELPFVRMRVACSKGTYIRTLCHDIGVKAGCGGAMASLVRVRSGMFRIEEALKLSQVEEIRDEGHIWDKLVLVEDVFSELPSVHVIPQCRKLIENGNAVGLDQVAERRLFGDGEEVRVYDHEGIFFGVYVCEQEMGRFRPRKMFMQNGE